MVLVLTNKALHGLYILFVGQPVFLCSTMLVLLMSAGHSAGAYLQMAKTMIAHTYVVSIVASSLWNGLPKEVRKAPTHRISYSSHLFGMPHSSFLLSHSLSQPSFYLPSIFSDIIYFTYTPPFSHGGPNQFTAFYFILITTL